MADFDDAGLSRRRLVGLVTTGLALGSAGALVPAGTAEAHGTIETYRGVWGQRTVYEGTGDPTSFGYRPSFHDRMSDWLRFWHRNTPATFDTPMRIWCLGVHYDGRPTEAHNSGRGFDLTRIVTSFRGHRSRQFFARHDKWGGWGAEARRRERTHYWATAASLHHHFQHVLTYPYNSAHDNHIHIDNLVSGSGNSSFHTGSRAQVLHVQACCRYIWGKSTSVDGSWGRQTRRHSTQVLRRIGRESGTITSQGNWLAFNRATLRKGYGVQTY